MPHSAIGELETVNIGSMASSQASGEMNERLIRLRRRRRRQGNGPASEAEGSSPASSALVETASPSAHPLAPESRHARGESQRHSSMLKAANSSQRSRATSASGRGARPVGKDKVQLLVAAMCALSILLAQFFYAGAMRPVLAFPAYLLLGIAGCVAFLFACCARLHQGSLWSMLPVGGLLAWLGWQCATSPDAWLSGTYWQLSIGCALMFTLMASIVRDSQARRFFLAILFAGAIAQGVLALYQVAGTLSIAPQGWYSEQLRIWFAERSPGRARGTYLNSNHLIWFLNAAGLYAIALGFWGRCSLASRLITLGCALFTLVVAIITLSRGGFLALIVGYSVFLLLSGVALLCSRSGKGRPLRLISLLLLVLLPLLGFTAVLRSGHGFSRYEGLLSDDYRSELWKVAILKLDESPLTGGGPGSFLYYSRLYHTRHLANDDYYAHNDWLQAAGDYGFIGFGLLVLSTLALVGAGGHHLYRAVLRLQAAPTRQSNGVAIAIGSLSAANTFIVHSCFDFNLQLPGNALLAASCAGLLIQMRRGSSHRAQGTQPQKTSKLLRLAFAGLYAGLAGAVIISLYQRRNEWHWLKGENALLQGNGPVAYMEAKIGQFQGLENPKLYRLYAESIVQRLEETREYTGALVALHDAEGALRRAIALAPQDRSNYIRLAEVLLHLSAMEDAKSVALKAITLAPAQARGFEICGWIFEQQGDLKNAEWMYHQASQVHNQKISQERLAIVRDKIHLLSEQKASSQPVP